MARLAAYTGSLTNKVVIEGATERIEHTNGANFPSVEIILDDIGDTIVRMRIDSREFHIPWNEFRQVARAFANQ